MEHFDLIIIGSGSGNAIPPALAEKWKVAIIERGVFGGTCLNVGCIPSKMFVLPADMAEQARHAPRLGVNTSFHDVDWPAVRDRVFGRIDPISNGGKEYRRSGHPNITLIEGSARFVGHRRIEVNGTTYGADRVLIATGARPAIPALTGLDKVRYHTSDTLMRVEKLPRRLAILGAGFIAVELGHVFSGFGSEVTMFSRSGTLLRDHDEEISQRFGEVFQSRVDLRRGQVPHEVRQVGDVIELIVRNGDDDEVIEVDELLVAIGRAPNSHDLDVHAAGIAVHPDGRIVTDDTMATNCEGVWAIGDVTNSHQLKHLANREAAIAFANMDDDGIVRSIDRSVLPYAVFSDPQIGAVGLTEQEARAKGLDVVVGKRDYGGTAFGWALEDETSFAKIIVERSTHKILGAHILGPQAATLIQLVVNAMTFGQTADELARSPFYVHPALTEVVENALIDALDQLAD